MVDISIGPPSNDCCICCGDCYNNCCACPVGDNLKFTIVKCHVDNLGVDQATTCCEEMEFDLEQRVDECWYHRQPWRTLGGSCDDFVEACCWNAECDTDVTKGDSTVFPEMWGFSGLTCDDGCSWDSPPQHQASCDGMCITASLCCCKTEDTPIGPAGCQHVYNEPFGPQEPQNPACKMTCFYFEMRGWEHGCYSTTDPPVGPAPICTYVPNCTSHCSPCSCCATREPPDSCGTCEYECIEEDEWELVSDDCDSVVCPELGVCEAPIEGCSPGDPNKDEPCVNPYTQHFGTFEGGCADAISGQCPTPNTDPEKKFILMVEGTYFIDCDCQTGHFEAATDVMYPVQVHYTGLITAQ